MAIWNATAPTESQTVGSLPRTNLSVLVEFQRTFRHGFVRTGCSVARYRSSFWCLFSHVSEFGLRKSLMAEVGMTTLSRHARTGEKMEI